jgi:hypothetical protein
MTTAPQVLGHGVNRPTQAVHVTGRRVVATIIDGLVFGIVYWLLAVAFGDIRTEGEAANWVSNLPRRPLRRVSLRTSEDEDSAEDLMAGKTDLRSGESSLLQAREVKPMGNWRGKYLDTGPPRGPGRHSEDGRWWWDDDQRRWFRVTDQEEVLEVEAEDMGGTSLAASLVTTLSSQYGNAYFRFVARVRSADPRWPTYAMAGATFPATRPSLEDLGAQGAWLETQRERFQELHQQLLAEGWRPAGHGAHWWSAIYRRPAIDWDTPADAQPSPSDPDRQMG